MNRIVYPDWWGEEDQNEEKKFNAIPKRLKSADLSTKAKINKNIARHCEDDLDKRLREVEQEVQLYNMANQGKSAERNQRRSKKHQGQHTHQEGGRVRER